MAPITHTTPIYTISEAAQMSGLPESTLRYYESIGLIHPIQRHATSKHRTYSETDMNLLVSIACLSATGMSLEDMRRYLTNRGRGAEKADEQVDLLVAQKLRLAEEARSLEIRHKYIELKIAYWQAIAHGDITRAEALGAEARIVADQLTLPKEMEASL